MSSLQTSPPEYTAPSATDDVLKLLSNAIELQESLRKAGVSIQEVDELVGTKFATQLKIADDKFLDLLNHSRSSASTLKSIIRRFVDVIVPASENPKIPFEKRMDIVKKEAKKIADAAASQSAPFNEESQDVKTGLLELRDGIAEMKTQVEKESRAQIKELQEGMASIARKVKEDKSLFDRLGDAAKKIFNGFISPVNPTPTKPPKAVPKKLGGGGNEQDSKFRPSKFVNKAPSSDKATPVKKGQKASHPAIFGLDFNFIFEAVSDIGAFFEDRDDAEDKEDQDELDKRAEELLELKKEVERKQIQLQRAIEISSELVDQVSGLVGKVGNFDAIWNKLTEDSKALNSYLENPHDDDEYAFAARVNAEKEIYSKITQALDEYVLQ